MEQTSPPREIMRPREAAEYLAIGTTTLDELRASGAVRSFRVGRSRRFRRSDLDDFAERRVREEQER